MTNHNDAIDRALERCKRGGFLTSEQAEPALRAILTDLDAEIERPLLRRIARMEREGFGDRARLAAVVDGIEREANPPLRNMTYGCCDRLLALARGEGGERGSSRHEPCEADAADREEAGNPAAPNAETKDQ